MAEDDVAWRALGSDAPHPELYSALSRRAQYVADMRGTLGDDARWDASQHADDPHRPPPTSPVIDAWNALDPGGAHRQGPYLHNARFVARVAREVGASRRGNGARAVAEEARTLDTAVRAWVRGGRHVLSADPGARLTVPRCSLRDALPAWRNAFVRLPALPSSFDGHPFDGCYVSALFPQGVPTRCRLVLTCSHGTFDDVAKQGNAQLVAALSRTVSVDYDTSRVGADGIGDDPNGGLPGVRAAVTVVVAILLQDAATEASWRLTRLREATTRGGGGFTLAFDVRDGAVTAQHAAACADGLVGKSVRRDWAPGAPWGGRLAGLRLRDDALVVAWEDAAAASAYSTSALDALRLRHSGEVRFVTFDGLGHEVPTSAHPSEDDAEVAAVAWDPFATTATSEPWSMDLEAVDDAVPRPRETPPSVPDGDLTRPTDSHDLGRGVRDRGTGLVVALKERWLDARCRSWIAANKRASTTAVVAAIQTETSVTVEGWSPEAAWVVRAKVEAARWSWATSGDWWHRVGEGSPLPWRGPWLPPGGRVAPEPTTYAGKDFPGFEEAVMAALCDLCGWRWVYDGKDGDFVVLGRSRVLVTLGPLGSSPGDAARSFDPTIDHLYVNGPPGAVPPSLGPLLHAAADGGTEGWAPGTLVLAAPQGGMRLGQVGLQHPYSTTDRITGALGDLPLRTSVVHRLLAQARLRAAGFDAGGGAHLVTRAPMSDLLTQEGPAHGRAPRRA